MNKKIIETITKTSKRNSLYHFTRLENLDSIAYFDTLYSSHAVYPNAGGLRRDRKIEKISNNRLFILNAHLHIAKNMMDPDTDIRSFRAFLDKNVFLWPTLRLCQEMLRTYSRREPHSKFVVLQFDAYPLLLDHYSKIRLSKYDSGSMPRYPARCSYRKTLRMFLPLDEFGKSPESLVPRVPSEIHEILVEQKVNHLGRYLRYVFSESSFDIPDHWRHCHRPLHILYDS